MKCLRFALLLFFVVPGTALAAQTALEARNVARGVNQSPQRFDLVGLHWKGSGTVLFRTRSISGRWSVWHAAAAEDDRPDAGSRELRRKGWTLGSPYWTGPSNRIQVHTLGPVRTIRA